VFDRDGAASEPHADQWFSISLQLSVVVITKSGCFVIRLGVIRLGVVRRARLVPGCGWVGDWVAGLGLGVAAVDGAEDAPWAWVVDGGGDATGGPTPWRVTEDEENLGMFAMNSFVLTRCIRGQNVE